MMVVFGFGSYRLAKVCIRGICSAVSGDDILFLHGCALSVGAGADRRGVVITGSSGAGKTTLVAGLLRHPEYSVAVLNDNWGAISLSRGDSIGTGERMLHMKTGSVLALRPGFFASAPTGSYSRNLSGAGSGRPDAGVTGKCVRDGVEHFGDDGGACGRGGAGARGLVAARPGGRGDQGDRERGPRPLTSAPIPRRSPLPPHRRRARAPGPWQPIRSSSQSPRTRRPPRPSRRRSSTASPGSPPIDPHPQGAGRSISPNCTVVRPSSLASGNRRGDMRSAWLILRHSVTTCPASCPFVTARAGQAG